jgi:nucleoside-diphosphate-sugar epimerase
MTNSFRKKIVLIGGSGTIGKILEKGLKDSYELLILDVAEPADRNRKNYIQADGADINQLMTAIPDDTHAIVNLSGLPQQPSILDEKSIRHCSDVYVVGTYNVLLAAERKKIKKVLLASSNHVTGDYESNGMSSLGREIRTDDYRNIQEGN